MLIFYINHQVLSPIRTEKTYKNHTKKKKKKIKCGSCQFLNVGVFSFASFKIKIWIIVASILLNIINYTIYDYIIQSYYQTSNPAVLELFDIMQLGVNFLSSVTVLMHDIAKRKYVYTQPCSI